MANPLEDNLHFIDYDAENLCVSEGTVWVMIPIFFKISFHHVFERFSI